MINQRRVFIGLAHVLADHATGDVLKGATGAYVNILCFVTAEAEFIAEAIKVLNHLGLKMVDVEDIEPLSIRMSKYEVDEDLLDLAKQLSEDRKVMLGSFHTYD